MPCAAVLLGLACGLAACGKKGPPLAPLRLVPAPVAEVSARRVASQVELRFVLPTRNQNGPGPVDLSAVEIYAITAAAGAPPPANRDLFTDARLVGRIEVRPPPPDGAEAPPADPADKRPVPGDAVTFVEELTAEELEPAAGTQAPVAGESQPGAAAGETEAPPAEQAPGGAAVDPAKGAAEADDARVPSAYPARIYSIRGVTRSGRAGQPSPRASIPLISPPAPPAAVAVQFTEHAFVLSWIPPLAEIDGPEVAFNVYRDAGHGAPLNGTPLAVPEFQHEGIVFGEEQCFAVRSLYTIAEVAVESAPSAAACETPRDIFAPAAPGGLQVVAAEDGISLSWDANTEPDVAGYIVLRGEPPDGTLQPLTREPIRETTYRDTAVTPGVRYVYTVVAIDNATPPNTSPQSRREEVTAR